MVRSHYWLPRFRIGAAKANATPMVGNFTFNETLGVQFPLQKTILVFLSLCNVNLVDGLIWSQEAVGSNPTMETNFALFV